MKKLEIKKVKNKKEYDETIKIRKTVFVNEQDVPEDLEIDGLDQEAEHFIAYFRNRPVGCARIRTIKGYAKLERIAISTGYRGKGFGKELTNFLIDYCKKRGFSEMHLHSQTYVSDFYKKLGFKPVGKKFFEAGIEHIEMVVRL